MKFGRLKQNSILSNNRRFAMRYPLKITNSSIQGLKTAILSVYNHFSFLNNVLLKNQNKIPLIFGRLLRSVVYDSAFNLIFPFLVNFSILPPNRIISTNQGFKHFSPYLCVLQSSEANQTIINKIEEFLSNVSLVDYSLSPCGFREPLIDLRFECSKLCENTRAVQTPR